VDEEGDFVCLPVDEKAGWSAQRENARLEADKKGANGGLHEGQKVKNRAK
jgi:hypothetical protein